MIRFSHGTIRFLYDTKIACFLYAFQVQQYVSGSVNIRSVLKRNKTEHVTKSKVRNWQRRRHIHFLCLVLIIKQPSLMLHEVKVKIIVFVYVYLFCFRMQLSQCKIHCSNITLYWTLLLKFNTFFVILFFNFFLTKLFTD